MEIDAAFGFAFLDIEVAFEIVVLRIFRDFPKGTQANWDFGVKSPVEMAGANKANTGAGEIDPGGSGSRKFRRAVKTCIDKIGGPPEGAAGEIGFAIEARVRERND